MQKFQMTVSADKSGATIRSGSDVRSRTDAPENLSGNPTSPDAEWLRAELGLIAVSGIPARIPAPPEPPVERRWPAARDARLMEPTCEMIRRHPDLTFAFGHLPDFIVRRHSRGFGSGIRKEFTSSVMGRDMFAFSSLEFDALRALELEPTVDAYIEQPLDLRYAFGGGRRSYRPDILCLRDGGLEFIEVKFEADARLLEPKWRAIGTALASVGLGFRVVTEKHLRRAPFHRNVRTVFLARHAVPPALACQAVLERLRTSGPMTLRELEHRQGLSFREACCLIRHGMLGADLETEPLDGDTTVRVSVRGKRDIWAARL